MISVGPIPDAYILTLLVAVTGKQLDSDCLHQCLAVAAAIM